MARRQVLILYRSSLLAQGVGNLLCKEKGLEIVSLQVSKDAIPGSYVVENAPDVIILDICDLGAETRPTILGLLEKHPGARVICLNPEDGRVDVYRKDRRTATRREELVEAIRSA